MKVFAKAQLFAVTEIDDNLSNEQKKEAISDFLTDIRLDLDCMQEGSSHDYMYETDVDESSLKEMKKLDSYMADRLSTRLAKIEDEIAVRENPDIKCYEILFDYPDEVEDYMSMCIQGYRKPTIEEAGEYPPVAEFMEKIGKTVKGVEDISWDEADRSFDMSGLSMSRVFAREEFEAKQRKAYNKKTKPKQPFCR